jgi:uncharacterized delta-60 repeat protein/gliding motility-associated-like protein
MLVRRCLALCLILFTRLLAFSQPGSIDATFNPGTGANATVWAVALQPDGKVLIGGDFTSYNGTLRNRIARLNADGSLDATFNPGTGPGTSVYSLAVQPDGKILIGGNFAFYNSIARNRIARLNSDGSLDATFNPGAGASNDILSIVLQPDGKILIGGYFSTYNGSTRTYIARLNSDGSVDATFVPANPVSTIHSIALQPDGKILVGGGTSDPDGFSTNIIARLNSNGSLDATFSTVTGSSFGFSFGLVNVIALQPDGKILAGGSFSTINSTARNGIARLNSNGTLEATFNPGTGTQDLNSIALQGDGKMVIGGAFTTYNGTTRNRIALVNADGSLDASFAPGTGTDNAINTLVLQPDNKVLIGGYFTNYNGTARNRIARVLNAALQQVTPGTLSASGYCAGSAISIPYTVSAAYTSGNVFIAQLSDALGSFASPVTLGTSTATGSGTISGTIPSTTAAGTGYRIRITSSNPVTTSADNGANLSISTPPTAGISYSSASFCTTGTATPTITGTTGGTFSSTAGLSINATTGVIDLSTSTAGTYTVTYTTPASGACTAVNATTSVTINAAPTLTDPADITACAGTVVTPAAFSGTSSSYTWTNSNTAIGLAASGTGNIGAFTSANSTTAPIAATVTVTPVNSAEYAYVPNGATVSVINLLTNTQETTVSVGSGPFGVAISPSGSYAYISNQSSNNVSVINTSTNTVTATIPVGSIPYGIAISPDGSKVFVANNQSATVSVINTATNTVSATVSVGTDPIGIAVSPDGSKVYVANRGSNNVSVINTATNTVSALLSANGPFGIVVSPDGSKVFVANQFGGSVSVFNGSTNALITTIAVGSEPRGITISPNGSRVYVANRVSNNTSVINTVTNSVVATVPVGTEPFGISVSADGSKVYVANFSTANLSVINTTTNTVSATIAASNVPIGFGNFIRKASNCTGTPQTFTITVNPQPAATISYTGSPFCPTGTAAPTFSGTTGGTYSSGTGLSINGGSGIIDLASSTPGTYTVTYTIPAAGGCTVVNATASVTIMSRAVISQPTDMTVCPGAATSAVTFSGSNGSTFTWSNNNTSIGLAASGSGNLPSFTPANSTSAQVTATITVNMSANAGYCAALPKTFTVTVNPTPTVNAVTSQTICNGSATTAVIFGGTASTYSWTNGNTAIGLAASGTGNISSFTAVNTGTTVQTATITVTPSSTLSGATCTGAPVSFTITVNPTPSWNPAGFSTSICNNQGIGLSISNGGNVAGATYSWTNSNPAIGTAATGSGNGLSFTGTNTGTSSISGTFTVTPSYTNGGVTCTGTPQTFTITVKPTPTVNAISSQTICAGNSSTAVSFSGAVTGTVFDWTNNNTSIGLAAGGSGAIAAFTAVNSTASPVVATISLTPTAAGCTGSTQAFTITVNPQPSASITGGTFCASGSTTLSVSGQGGGTFSAPAGLSINSTSGAINLAASTPGTYTVTYAYTNGFCAKTATSSVTVNALPVATISGGSFCNTGSTTLTVSGQGGGTFSAAPGGLGLNTATGAINLSASTPGSYTVTYTFTNGTCTNTTTSTITVQAAPSAAFSYAGSPYCSGPATATPTFSGTTGGTFTSTTGLSVNATTGAINIGASTAGTYTVTYTVAAAGSCGQYTQTASITINPSVTATITASGPLTLCAGGNVTLSAPATTGATYLWSTGATTASITVSAAGNYSVLVTANGCTANGGPVAVTINPTPTVDVVAGQAICNGASTATVAFSGAVSGTVYNWTNSNTSIGLAASGSGNIAAFNTINSTATVQTATITVTPSYTNNGVTCTGTPRTFTITVNPTPFVNAVANQTLCNGAATTAIGFSGVVSGTSYAWTNSNTSIGLAASGSGNIASFTAINNGATVQTATITITPSANGCTGTPVTFTITVNPTPTVSTPASQTLCNGAATAAINFSGTVAGSTYSWTNSNTSVGLSAAGVGNIASFTAINTTSTIQTATITVTPSANGCSGAPVSFTITFNPTPAVNAITSQALCNGAATAAVNFSGAVSGTSYAWTNSNASIGLAASGTGAIASFTATNSTAAPVTATITVTPSANGCSGTPGTFTITVNPTPTVNAVASQTLCSGAATTAITFTGAVSGTSYSWSNSNTSIGLAATGTGGIASFTAVNTTGTVQTATITVTPAANGCTGAPATFTITVNPTPSVNAVTNQSLCAGAATSAVNFSSPASGTSYSWTNNTTSIGLAASGTGNIASFTAVNTGSAPVTATVTVTPSANGCTGTPVTFTITVNPQPTGTITSPGGTLICQGSSVPLQVSGGTSYQWLLNGTPITGATAATYNATQAGTYSVNITNAQGCTAAAANTITTTFGARPTAAFSWNTFCQGAPVQFVNQTNTTGAGTVTYQWSFGNGQSSTLASPTATYTAAGSYTVQLVASAGACASLNDTLRKTITIEAPIAGGRLAPQNVVAGVPTQLQARNLADGHYQWTPGTGLSNPQIWYPIATLNQEQEYRIAVNFASGCVTVDTLLVRIFGSNDIIIPTAFSPDGDGLNDVLRPVMAGISSLRFFRVYDRMGHEVFSSSSSTSGWDGRYMGKAAPAGTYVWVVEGTDRNNQPLRRQGQVLLVR